MQMLTEISGRKVCSVREAAKTLGVTPGRVRQMATAREIWSEHVTEFAVVLDRDEIARLAKARAKETGPRPGRPSIGARSA